MVDFVLGDCLEKLKNETCDVIVTSPPYNLNHLKYSKYKNQKRNEYLDWCKQWIILFKAILNKNGSLFLNLGGSCNDPWISLDVAQLVREHFVLQNRLIWTKSISINDQSYGHYRPVTSDRYLTLSFEDIYHFTHDGQVKLNRLAIGVPFVDQFNASRWGEKENKRCRGNVWFIPYDTRHGKDNHPCPFPRKLVEYCLKLHGLDKIDKVIDPFCGNGTTGVVCRDLNLNCMCVDIDEKYIENAKKRVNNG